MINLGKFNQKINKVLQIYFRYNSKRASLVQSRIKAINKMDKVEEILEDPSIVFIFPTPDKVFSELYLKLNI